jgi:protein HOOK3
MAVQSEKNNTFVQDLQQLPLEHQHTLMGAIEETMSQLGAPSTGGDTFSSDNNKDMLSERTIMEKKISDLEKSLVSLKVESDSALQEEIEGLKVMLISSQSKNTELESQLSKEKMIVRELGNDAENSASCDDELRIARQELDVLRRIVDGRQPNKEMSIVKTKEKKAEANEIEKAVSMLESQLLSSNQKNTHLTEQLQKFNGLKSVVDAYKAQIANLEDKNTTLHVDNTILSFQVHDAAQKASRYEFERVQEFEKIAELQDQIKDLGFYNVFIVESNSLNAFAVDSVPAEVVNERVSFLESELQRFRTQAVEDKKRGDQIQLYEQILSDSKILCEKFETV